jgi:branched-chain amino acid transport system substrate-binding protein
MWTARGRKLCWLAIAAVGCRAPSISPAWAQDSVPAERPFIYSSWETFTARDGLPDDHVRAIHVCGDRVWVGTEAGLAVCEAGAWTAWTHLDREKRVPLGVISAIAVDPRTQDAWLGTLGRGLVRFSAGRFEPFDQINSGLAGNLVFDSTVRDGRVWAATNGGISSFDPLRGTWDLYLERRADAPETAVTHLYLDPSGANLYAAAWCEGVRRIDLTRGTLSTVLGPGRSGPSDLPLAFDWTEKAWWWASSAQVCRRGPSGTWEVRPTVGHGSPDDFIYCLTARRDSEVWLGTDRGLQVLADWATNTWVTYRRGERGATMRVTVSRDGQVLDTRVLDSGIPDNRVRCVAFQGEDVWVGTAGGLAHATRIAPPAHVSEGGAYVSQGGTDKVPPGQKPGGALSVAVGVLSPASQTIFLPGQGVRPPAAPDQVDIPAVQLAVEQANARGGYLGQVPYELITDVYGYARYGWNLPEDDFVTLAYQARVWGIVAGLGSDRRLAGVTALRTEVPVVNVAATPATVDESVNPWVFRCPGDDPQRQHKLLVHILRQLGHTRLAVLRTPGRAAQTHLDRWAHYARDQEHPLVADIPWDSSRDDLGPALEALQRCRAEVVLTWCDAETAAAILRRLRAAGMAQLFVGNERMVTDEFVRLVGGNPGPVVALGGCSAAEDEEEAARFAESYEARFKRRPRPEAFRSYDAARHLLQAINLAGLERDAIRRTLRDMSTAFMVRLDEGRWQYSSSPTRGDRR